MSELKSLLLGCRPGIQFKAAGHHHSALATFVALATYIKDDLTPLPPPQRMLWGCLGAVVRMAEQDSQMSLFDKRKTVMVLGEVS